MSHRRATTVLVSTALIGGLVLTGIASSVAGASPGAVPLAMSQSPAATRTPRVGAAPAGSQVDFELVLAPRSPAAAQRLATAVSTPGDPAYRQFLTAAQWEAQVLSDGRPGGSRHLLGAAAGPAGRFGVGRPPHDRGRAERSAEVEHAFATTLSLHSVDGRTLRLADSALSVPSSLSGVIVGASGVSQSVATPDDTTDGPSTTASAAVPSAVQPKGFRTPQPCGSYFGQVTDSVQPPYGNGYPSPAPYAVCGYTPPQIRSAYALPSESARGRRTGPGRRWR